MLKVWKKSSTRISVINFISVKTISGDQARGIVIGTTLGRAQYCCFNTDDLLVAVCIDKEVVLLDTKVKKFDVSSHTGFPIVRMKLFQV